MKATIITASLCLTAVLTFSTPAAQAAPSAAAKAHTITVELADSVASKTTRTSYSLRVAGHRPATVRVSNRGTTLKLTVQIRRRAGNTAVVSVDLSRTNHSKTTDDRAVLSLDSRVAMGKRANIATLPQPRGGNLSVALTVR